MLHRIVHVINIVAFVVMTIYLLEDVELQYACQRAYNDFLSEFCSTDPERLLGLAMIPTDSVELGVQEIVEQALIFGLTSHTGKWSIALSATGLNLCAIHIRDCIGLRRRNIRPMLTARD